MQIAIEHGKVHNMNTVTLGILGGLGPMSGIYFCEMLTAHTRAGADQEHIDFLLSSKATTPDRTDYILGRSPSNPAVAMTAEVNKLISAGADLIAIPCNTAHYFYDTVAAASSVPIINIIDQTVEFCKSLGISRVGVLATEGTVSSGAYENALRQAGMEYLTCQTEDQTVISHIIYDQIKKGLPPDTEAFRLVAERLRQRGAQALILGCTELSLLKRECLKDSDYIDSLEVLACAAIRLCGKEPIGFDPALMNFQPMKGIYPCC